MEAFDSTKTGNFNTNIKEVMTYSVNWDKVKTFEDLTLLFKHNIILCKFIKESDLKGKDKDIKKFFKAAGTKVLQDIDEGQKT